MPLCTLHPRNAVAVKRNPGKTLKLLKYISRTFFSSPVFIIPKVRQSSTFIINIFICAYNYIYISIYKQFPMHANTTETSTCPNIAISSKDNKGQYNPTLIELDCHTLT